MKWVFQKLGLLQLAAPLLQISGHKSKINVFSEDQQMRSKKEKKTIENEKEYEKLINEAVETALTIMASGKWKEERAQGHDVVQSCIVPVYGKVFRFIGIINWPLEHFLSEIFYKVEHVPKWNPTITEAKILRRINERTDIIHIISAPGAKGLVSGRDFVTLRTWQRRGKSIVHGMVSVNLPEMPEQPPRVRGEQGPSVYIITPVEGCPNKCQMQWLSNANLRGWLPQYLIDQAMSTVMLDYVANLRKYVSSQAKTFRQFD
ncbi:steroidogenic acute regulatory protein, mitochondrial-like isoform X1 [Tachypleus tridentatus]|uniref:steroidogenic acute regulatory protein, mitochondrial-like isoform X1 n=3 Tax=Tachypleus tridentatus TaxID=6853 RepID=UPI003FD2817C